MQRAETFQRQEDDGDDQQPGAKPRHARQGREQLRVVQEFWQCR